jgi:FKBP-type peptidyl-prolyl cis-trans isomerase
MPKKTSLTLAAIAVGVAVAGCGGSGSTAPGVATAPSAGSTQGAITTAPAATSTTSTTSSASVPTPTSGALSTEPKVPVNKGTPPKTLQTKDLITGTGATAKSGSTITVNYVGALYKNGKIFDASWNRKQTFTTPLATSSVIPGWVQGISGMKVGGRRVLIIPPSLGYGKTGSPPTIPGNATLVFVVDLLKVG